ncbi:MAG: cyclopropane-fatty-acyl-phospholipid synthase family protein [Kofleriaceae bacterium]
MDHLAEPVGASRAAIQHHYDVDNDFYALWLDETRTYSCAMYEGEGDSLERAQARKLDYIARAAGARGARRVLDIGCGWGGLLTYLAREDDDSELVGLTLSREQRDYVEAVSRGRLDVRLEAWEAHQPSEPYDAIVSVGAFEHFARPDAAEQARVAGYRAFFTRCRQWLRPGGRMYLQTICYDRAERSQFPEFFRESVFPESDLPRPHEVLAAADRRFHLVELRNDAADYARTLLDWRTRLWARRREAAALVGEDVVRHFLKYLALSQVSFHTRTTGLLRLTLARADELLVAPPRGAEEAS